MTFDDPPPPLTGSHVTAKKGEGSFVTGVGAVLPTLKKNENIKAFHECI